MIAFVKSAKTSDFLLTYMTYFKKAIISLLRRAILPSFEHKIRYAVRTAQTKKNPFLKYS
jgi:hypothetical protein